LSGNPSAMQLLEKNPDKIDWYWLSGNPSEGAIQLLEKNQDKIYWEALSQNQLKSAIQLLEKNQDKIYWEGLSQNSHIFNYDYNKMKDNCMLFKEDLMKNRYHPCNISKFKNWRVNGFEFDSY